MLVIAEQVSSPDLESLTITEFFWLHLHHSTEVQVNTSGAYSVDGEEAKDRLATFSIGIDY